MKTFGAFLALAAFVASADALARFDKASCLSSAPTTPINVVAGDGSWNCVDFNLAQTGVFTMPFIKSGSANVALEIMLWNDGRADSDTANGNYRWNSLANSNAGVGTSSDNVWLRKFIPGANGDQNDFNGVDFSQNVTQGGEAMTMSTVTGWNTNAGSSGVYAWYTGTNQLVNFAQGRNYIQMLHPNRMSSSSVSGSFGGKFMYRLLARNGLQDNVNGASLDESQASSFLPTLNVGRATSVQHLALPSFTLNFRVNHEFATAGYALKGFTYTAAFGGNRVGSLVNQRMFYNRPVGYTPYAGSNLTFSSSGTVLEAGNSWTLYQNYTKTGQFSPSGGVEQINFASDITTFKNNWTLPLDVRTTTDAERSDFGQLGVYVPDFSLASGVVAALAYDWSSQTSPFIDVTVTIDEVVTYPMLSELRNLHLRNWDTDEANGHNLLSPTQQQAFGLYRVRIDSPLWWGMRVRFNDVRDMNAPSGVGAGEPLPEACQPLWEMQVVNDVNTGGSSFSDNEGTAFGRRQNGFGVEFPTYHTNARRTNYPEGYDWEASFGGSKLEENGQTYALNRAWARRSGAIRGEDQELAFLASTRPSWYLVRVAALPRILPGQGTFDGQCGSNNIRIGSASLELLGVAGECSSSRDCMVEADGHPAEDRADSDDSANGDATRFSRCVVTESLTADGRRAPTTQCMECTADAHCRSGQYCHTDDGLCTLPANSPAQFTRYYTCDAESRALRGVCREKSTDVLGKTCKPHTLSTQTAFNTMKHPALNNINSGVNGGSAGLTRGSNIAVPNELDPQEFDPSNDDFGTGSGGICGEFRYFNSTGVSSVVSAPLQGTTNDPAFSLAGTVRRGLWWGMCDEDRICRECVPGSGSQGNNAKDGRICLNGQMFSAADVDGTNRSYTANTQAGTQLGTTFMVILLIILFAFYMYAQAKEFRHENGLKPMSCCECILCCGACSKLGGAADAPKEPAAAAADDSKVAPTA